MTFYDFLLLFLLFFFSALLKLAFPRERYRFLSTRRIFFEKALCSFLFGLVVVGWLYFFHSHFSCLSKFLDNFFSSLLKVSKGSSYGQVLPTVFTIFLAVITGIIFYVVKQNIEAVKEEKYKIEKYYEKIREYFQESQELRDSYSILAQRMNLMSETYNEAAERVFNLLAPIVCTDNTNRKRAGNVRRHFVVDREFFLLWHSDEQKRIISLIQIKSFLKQPDYSPLVRTDEMRKRLEWIKENDKSEEVRQKAKEVLDLMWGEHL